MIQSAFIVIIFLLYSSPVLFAQIYLDRICEPGQYEGGVVSTGLYQASETMSSDDNLIKYNGYSNQTQQFKNRYLSK